MPKKFRYEGNWKGFDRGREGLLDPIIWYGVLDILSRHEGEAISDPESKMYSDLEKYFPQTEWISSFDSKHNFFRDYQTPWTLTGVLVPTKETGNKIEVTPLGRALIRGKISLKAVWTQAMASYLERNGERPFSILAAAFIAVGDIPLTLEQIYYGIERGWRPSDSKTPKIPAVLPKKVSSEDVTPVRRLRAMLKHLVESGAVSSDDSCWKAGNIEILKAISSGKTMSADDEDQAQGVGFSLENSVENDLALLAEVEDDLPSLIREKVMRSIAVRRGQPRFRKVLLGLYDRKCAISRWDADAALEAAHILPMASNGNHDPSNGLLLRADLHTLFDLNYIGIEPQNFAVAISPVLFNSRYNQFNGKQIHLPISVADQPSRSALAEHYNVLIKK